MSLNSILGTIHLRKNKTHIIFYSCLGPDDRMLTWNDNIQYIYKCTIDMANIDYNDLDLFNDLEIFEESEILIYDSDFIDEFIESLINCGFTPSKI
jgi:hypothetical protein